MTVTTKALTFAYLRLDRRDRTTSSDHRANVLLLITQMIKLKDNYVRLTTYNAGVVPKKSGKQFSDLISMRDLPSLTPGLDLIPVTPIMGI